MASNFGKFGGRKLLLETPEFVQDFLLWEGGGGVFIYLHTGIVGQQDAR